MIRELSDGGYFGSKGKVAKWHEWLSEKLCDLEKEDDALISGPFGVGAMVAFTPYEGDPKRVTHFVKELYQRGVMSFIAGSHPMRVRFLLPIGGLSDDHLESAWAIVEETLLDCRDWKPD
jgi:acetylornithine/succinyldiaminopimelate/putrescine aminotransferase